MGSFPSSEESVFNIKFNLTALVPASWATSTTFGLLYYIRKVSSQYYLSTGGGKKVTRVEVTLDGGETWSVCTLDHPEKPTRYGKYWCWCFWSLEVEVLDLLSAKEIAVRAVDETLNTQPEKLIWNVMVNSHNLYFQLFGDYAN